MRNILFALSYASASATDMCSLNRNDFNALVLCNIYYGTGTTESANMNAHQDAYPDQYEEDIGPSAFKYLNYLADTNTTTQLLRTTN